MYPIDRRDLRCDDHEGIGQRSRRAVDADLSFEHGFEQGALCAWFGAIDFVGEQDVCEDWAIEEVEIGGFWVVDRDAQYIAWQYIGCELKSAIRQAR